MADATRLLVFRAFGVFLGTLALLIVLTVPAEVLAAILSFHL